MAVTRANMDRRMAQIEKCRALFATARYADPEEPSEALKTKTSHPKEKIAKHAASRGSQGANARHSRSADIADGSRFPVDGDERARLRCC
jgi:hypothetical protein